MASAGLPWVQEVAIGPEIAQFVPRRLENVPARRMRWAPPGRDKTRQSPTHRGQKGSPAQPLCKGAQNGQHATAPQMGPRPGAVAVHAHRGAAGATPGLGEGDFAIMLARPWGWQPASALFGASTPPKKCRGGLGIGAACSPWPAAGSTWANVYATRRAGCFFTYAKSSISAAGVMPSRRPAWANVAGRTWSSRWRTSAERPAILA